MVTLGITDNDWNELETKYGVAISVDPTCTTDGVMIRVTKDREIVTHLLLDKTFINTNFDFDVSIHLIPLLESMIVTRLAKLNKDK
jgi:hypothetical protein